ncbi:hypothetical protein NC651_006035 [Populus alba x Populus x berolinensis]|nr:hypothetical protein NC651_006035 [Populus alba x Populus x berolinensis]
MQKVNNEGTTEHVLEFSQGFSATHFKGKSSLKKHLGFFQSSHSEKAASKEPVLLLFLFLLVKAVGNNMRT